jgi:hypothetical protein
MWAVQGKTIQTIWIDVNKGDSEKPVYRSRLVGKEFRTHADDTLYASTPPLESKRMLFSEFATRRTNAHGKPLELSVVDIRKAYLNGVPKRNIKLSFPKELGLSPHKVAHLKRCVYGTRDAGQIWEDCYANALVEMGFKRGIASPCCFHHQGRDLCVVVHGDDFTCLGIKEDHDWYESELAARFEIKLRGRIGTEKNCIPEIRI